MAVGTKIENCWILVCPGSQKLKLYRLEIANNVIIIMIVIIM